MAMQNDTELDPRGPAYPFPPYPVPPPRKSKTCLSAAILLSIGLCVMIAAVVAAGYFIYYQDARQAAYATQQYNKAETLAFGMIKGSPPVDFFPTDTGTRIHNPSGADWLLENTPLVSVTPGPIKVPTIDRTEFPETASPASQTATETGTSVPDFTPSGTNTATLTPSPTSSLSPTISPTRTSVSTKTRTPAPVYPTRRPTNKQ